MVFFLSSFFSSTIFLAQEGQSSRSQNMSQTFLMIGLALVFFYLIMWRPEQKRRKKMQKQRESLSKGDRVTAMGIVGTIASLKEDTVILKMVEGAKIEILKTSITNVIPAAEESKKEGAISSPQETHKADS